MALEIPSLADGILAHSWTELILQRAVPLLLTLYLLRAGYYCFFHPLHAIPGPWLARFSKSWINIHYFRGSWLDDVIGLHQKYGPVVRIAPDEVSFVDESALKQLYGHGKFRLSYVHTLASLQLIDASGKPSIKVKPASPLDSRRCILTKA